MNDEFKKVRKVDIATLSNFIAEKTDYSNIKPLNLKFDVIFMSYNEKGADKNYEILKKFVPNAKRVHGVKGIINAYNACRELSETKFFYVVEGDNIICNDFDFKLPIEWHKQVLHYVNLKADNIDVSVDNAEVYTRLNITWDTVNPVNGEVLPHSPIYFMFKATEPYTYGKKETEAASFAMRGVGVNKIASIDAFNSSPYDAWKAGFRIGNKLAYYLLNLENLIPRKLNRSKEDIAHYNEERLHHWESVGYDSYNGKYCIEGVKLGKSMAKKHGAWWLEYRKTSQDFDNLKNIFIKEYGTEYYNN